MPRYIPSVLSFTVETDGKLPSGQELGDAIREVDRETDGGPSYYMVNCAHPSHFDFALDADSDWGLVESMEQESMLQR